MLYYLIVSKFGNLTLCNKFYKAVSSCFIFLICTFAIKVEKRKYALICVSSFNSANSAWKYNIKAMLTIAIIILIMIIIIIIIIIAIMITVIDYFHMSALINLQNAIFQFINETKLSEKK